MTRLAFAKMLLLFAMPLLPIAFFTSVAEAKPKVQTRMLLSITTCKTWNEDRLKQAQDLKALEEAPHDKSLDSALKRSSLATTYSLSSFKITDELKWMLGFLSGLNSLPLKGGDRLEKIDSGIVRDWTDSYCKKNPEKLTADSAISLFLKLSE